MKRLIVSTSFCLLVLGVKAQNLVPNYSFEDTIQCVNSFNEFTGYVKNWTGQAGGLGLCYFTSQCSSNQVGVPINIFGHQYAHTGVSYAGIYTYFDSAYFPGFYNFRNYIQDSLVSPLLAGITYYVTFYVSLTDTSKYACNNMGAYFSDSALVWSGKVKSYLTPQVTNDIVHHPLTDKVNWMKVSGNFVAAGGEQYIIIGNFVDDAHVDTVFVNSVYETNPQMAAYYYIDDVIVSTDSTYADSLFTGVNEIKPLKESVKVYPNPANNLLNVSIDLSKGAAGYSICLYNSEGELMRCEPINSNLTTLSISKLLSGIYYYRITDNEGNLVKADKIAIVH